jgi:GT2 family glycosyltransferase
MMTSMKPRADISVCIATLQRPEALLRCLNALLEGDVLPAQIVIVDQSRDAQTQQMLEAARAEWGEAAPPLVYSRQERRGLSASRNAATALAQCGILTYTDDDCVPDAKWIEAIRNAFAEAPEPASVSGRVLPLGPEVPGTYPVSTRLSTQRTDYAGSAIPWLAGTGGNMSVTREWLERIGPYDERLGPGAPGKGGEDVDLLYRLLRAGGRCRYDPDVLIYHERQDGALRSAKSWSYSYGIGACCGKWLRHGHARAGYLFGARLYHMLRDAARAAVRHDRMMAQQRWIAARGVCAGLAFGMAKSNAATPAIAPGGK